MLLTSVMRTPFAPFTAWKQSALSFLLSTDLGRLWTHRRVFDTNTFMSRSFVLFTSSNWNKIKHIKKINNTGQHRSNLFDKNQLGCIKIIILTLVLLIMSASGTPSAALVPARITGHWSQYKHKFRSNLSSWRAEIAPIIHSFFAMTECLS